MATEKKPSEENRGKQKGGQQSPNPGTKRQNEDQKKAPRSERQDPQDPQGQDRDRTKDRQNPR